MRMLHLEKLEDLQSAGEWLTPGDCVEVDSLSALTGNVKELLAALVMINDRAADFVSLQEGIDTREGQGASFFALCRVLSEAECFSRRRDGIDKAKEEEEARQREQENYDNLVADSDQMTIFDFITD